MAKKALLLGASGLIGNEVLNLLLHDNYFEHVTVFVRKLLLVEHPKLKQQIVDFDNLETYKNEINGDIVFCCIGSTIKKAGSQDAFTKVDLTYPLEFAKLSKQNGIKQFLLVSSLGANGSSSNFYLKVKGDLESNLEKIKFENLIILRPSMLLGNRKEFRLGEIIGKAFMQIFSFLFFGKLKKYKAIEASDVAKAIVNLSKAIKDEVKIVESDELKIFSESIL